MLEGECGVLCGCFCARVTSRLGFWCVTVSSRPTNVADMSSNDVSTALLDVVMTTTELVRRRNGCDSRWRIDRSRMILSIYLYK